MLIGVILLLNGFAALVTRNAALADDHRQTLEVSAAVGAARLDAVLATVANTLTIVDRHATVERLARTLGMVVCAATDRIHCAAGTAAGAGVAAVGADGELLDPVVAAAVERIASPTADALSRTSVVRTADEAAAHAVVVVVAHDERMLLAIMMPAVSVVLARSSDDDEDGGRDGRDLGADSVTAPLETDLGGGSWVVRTTSERHDGWAGRDLLLIGSQLLLGTGLMAGPAWAVTRNLRGLRRRATIDALTGLPNRVEFERLATRALAAMERERRDGCMVVIDLDRFKSINDTIGHAAGDRALREAGTRLAGAVRASDLVGRWGGDEFVLLLDGIGDPLAIPDRIAAIAAGLGDVPGAGGAGLTASVGTAVFPVQGRDLVTLLDVADRAMYVAKSVAAATEPSR